MFELLQHGPNGATSLGLFSRMVDCAFAKLFMALNGLTGMECIRIIMA